MRNYHVILVSHGDMAKETLKSFEMVTGECSYISTLSLHPEVNLEEFTHILRIMISTISPTIKKILIACDILGGTPHNASTMLFLENPKIEVITSFNMSMLVALLEIDEINRESLVQLVHDSKDSIKFLEN
ncbi:MAG: PTS sugar transporter subunit IIA [Brevinema sp.]